MNDYMMSFDFPCDFPDGPLPEYDTILFTGVWHTQEAFITDYMQAKITPVLNQEQASMVYFLLYSRYGNAPIAFRDVEQFKYAVFATVFQYAPTWLKKLEIQEKLRGLTEKQLLAGGKNITNYALHPDEDPSDGSLEELEHISQQTVVGHKRGRVEAYANLLRLLEDDVTESFLERFRKLFLKFLSPYRSAIYPNKED